MISSYFIVIFFTLASNIVGFLKEVLSATYFGISPAMDSYILAFTFINIFVLIFVAGPLQGAFIPKFLRKYNESEGSAWNYAYNILLTMFLLSAGISLLIFLMVKSDTVLNFIAPGFAADQVILFNQFISILLIYLVFCNVSTVITSLLQALEKYSLACIPPIINNIMIISILYFFHLQYGVFALVTAIVIGCLVGLLFQIVTLVFFVTKPKVDVRIKYAEIKEFIGFVIPMILLVLVDQFDALAQRSILSLTGEGSISILNYSYKLVGIPIGLLGGSIATVAFPVISGLISTKNDTQLINEKISNTVNFLIFTLIPITVFMLMFNLPIVTVFFERGQFDAEVSRKVAYGLFFYSWGILPQSLLVMFNRIFYAYNDSKTPLMIGIFTAVIHVILCYYLALHFGYIGIALGSSIYAFSYFFILYYMLHIKWIKQNHKIFLKKFISILLVSIITGILVSIYHQQDWLQLGKYNIIITTIVFLFSYIIISLIARIEEMTVVLKFAVSKVKMLK